MSELLAIGVSHKTAPVEVRERLALPEARAAEFLRDLRGAADVQEAVAISTCNRMELYLVVGDPVEAESTALAMLASQAGIRPTAFASAIYSHRNCDAARHLYRVTAGLESMIVGENEIQGQVKRAYDAALAKETRRAAHQPPVQGRARDRQARAHRDRDLRAPAQPPRRRRRARPRAARRSRRSRGRDRRHRRDERTDRARARRQRLSHGVRREPPARPGGQPRRRYGGRSVSFDELPDALGRADIVLAATASPHLLLEARELAEVMQARGGRPMLLIDLAVPRDIDSSCAELDGVSLYDIDDLQAVIARNRKVRQAEARKAEGIIEEEIQHFAAWLGSLEVLPTLAALRAHATAIAEQVVRENAGKWESASPRDLERIDALARAVVNRLLHDPTVRMKELRDDRVHARMALVRDLFGIAGEDGAFANGDGALAGEELPPPAPEDEELAEVRELRRR